MAHVAEANQATSDSKEYNDRMSHLNSQYSGGATASVASARYTPPYAPPSTDPADKKRVQAILEWRAAAAVKKSQSPHMTDAAIFAWVDKNRPEVTAAAGSGRYESVGDVKAAPAAAPIDPDEAEMIAEQQREAAEKKAEELKAYKAKKAKALSLASMD